MNGRGIGKERFGLSRVKAGSARRQGAGRSGCGCKALAGFGWVWAFLCTLISGGMPCSRRQVQAGQIRKGADYRMRLPCLRQ